MYFRSYFFQESVKFQLNGKLNCNSNNSRCKFLSLRRFFGDHRHLFGSSGEESSTSQLAFFWMKLPTGGRKQWVRQSKRNTMAVISHWMRIGANFTVTAHYTPLTICFPKNLKLDPGWKKFVHSICTVFAATQFFPNFRLTICWESRAAER